MKGLERLEKITVVGVRRMQEEVSALLGKNITFGEPQTLLLSKAELFERLVGKHVLAHADLEGDLSGSGCMLVGLKDAVRIGGTLIMLPESELESVCGSEEYSEELSDSFGEVANIIAGAMTSTFEENYPKSFRLVRKTQEVVIPAKVDPASAVPVADGIYCCMQSAMKLQDTELGAFYLALPAESFGLVESAVPTEEQPAATEAEKTEAKGPDASQAASLDDKGMARTRDAEGPAQPAGERKKQDPAKIKDRVDRLLEACRERIGTEVGALLGGALELTRTGNRFCSKAELLEQCNGKQILVRLDVRGDAEGEAFLLSSLKDAIFLGGTLIMLPDSELEETVRNEELGADAEDAYGEIANIVSGVYTTVFEEQFSKKLGFVKTRLEKILPIKINPDDDEVIPCLPYYLQAVTMRFKDRDLGNLLAVFPAEIFDLESPVQTAEAESQADARSREGAAFPADQKAAAGSAAHAAVQAAADMGEADILVIGDEPTVAGQVGSILQQFGHVPKVVSFKDDVADYLPGAIRMIFLVMAQVTEQGFGVAIRISSVAGAIPLVAAGPAWTRSTVLKAVKYGADDILVTPPLAGDIQEKLRSHLGLKAA